MLFRSGEVLDSLLESFSEETVAHLADRVGSQSGDDLEKLSETIALRRKVEGK